MNHKLILIHYKAIDAMLLCQYICLKSILFIKLLSSFSGSTKLCVRGRKECLCEVVGGSRSCSTWLLSIFTALNKVVSALSLISAALGAVGGRQPKRFVFLTNASNLSRSPSLAKPHHAGDA